MLYVSEIVKYLYFIAEIESLYRKVPKFSDAEVFAVNYLKFEQRGKA